MLRAFAILLTCQLAGEAITRGLELPLLGVSRLTERKG
jgi:putative effector of murein hydrolase LrgA (UPF0299 family)